MERSLTPVEIGVRRPDKKIYLWFCPRSVHEAGSGEVFSLPVVHYSNCPNCGCGYLETTSGGDILEGGSYSTYDNYGLDAYDEYDARKDGYPGWY